MVRVEVVSTTNFAQGVYRHIDGRLVVNERGVWGFEALYNKMYEILHHQEERTWWFRCTNNPREHEILDRVVSRNHVDGHFEDGLSVSEHPYYQLWGYEYIYVVTGELVGTGSEGEPVIRNARALTIPAPELPEEWRKRYEEERRQNAERAGLTIEEAETLRKICSDHEYRATKMTNETPNINDLTMLFDF